MTSLAPLWHQTLNNITRHVWFCSMEYIRSNYNKCRVSVVPYISIVSPPYAFCIKQHRSNFNKLIDNFISDVNRREPSKKQTPWRSKLSCVLFFIKMSTSQRSISQRRGLMLSARSTIHVVLLCLKTNEKTFLYGNEPIFFYFWNFSRFEGLRCCPVSPRS